MIFWPLFTFRPGARVVSKPWIGVDTGSSFKSYQVNSVARGRIRIALILSNPSLA